MTRILLMRSSGALGDIVLTMPLVTALRNSFPDAHIELCGNTSLLDIARSTANTIVSPPEGIWNLHSSETDISKDLHNYLESFDLVIVFGSEEEPAVKKLHDICRKVISVESIPSGGTHAADWYLEPLQAIGIRGSSVPVVEPDPENRKAAERFWINNELDRYPEVLCFAPGSGSPTKCWPRERFEQTVNTIRNETGAGIVEILGPVEEGEGPPQIAAKEPGWITAINLPVNLLAAVLEKCSVFIGNDSGVTHLSAAVGTRTIALFGPTDPAVWGPRGKNVAIVNADTHCAPCTEAEKKACVTRECLEMINTEQVTAQALSMRLALV